MNTNPRKNNPNSPSQIRKRIKSLRRQLLRRNELEKMLRTEQFLKDQVRSAEVNINNLISQARLIY